ncbi:hypothetical protein [Micromonospora sonneratiae]|uniref:Uncharacterized protein n=1 Tax=Micromonospora sonneratiae TaxID=1184706 RepID=A0ABW3YMC2_9ACTN
MVVRRGTCAARIVGGSSAYISAQDPDDVLALNRALRDRTAAYSQLLKVCSQAGYK